MKRILVLIFTCLSLLLISVNVYAESRSSQHNVEGCIPEECIQNRPEIISEKTNEDGNLIISYNNGVEVEITDEGTYIIRDYQHSINNSVPEFQTRASWTEIGKAIIRIIKAILDSCSSIQYLTGHDICRIVLTYISTPKTDGTYTYLLSGRYISGYIPGCEPAHSLPCNSGYWEYKVVRS